MKVGNGENQAMYYLGIHKSLVKLFLKARNKMQTFVPTGPGENGCGELLAAIKILVTFSFLN